MCMCAVTHNLTYMHLHMDGNTFSVSWLLSFIMCGVELSQLRTVTGFDGYLQKEYYPVIFILLLDTVF